MGYTTTKNTQKYYKYKEKYKKYKSLCNTLEDKYDDASAKVRELDTHLAKVKAASTMTSGEIGGRPVELFDNKCVRYHSMAADHVSDFKTMITLIVNRLNSARNKRDNYKLKMDYEKANPIVEHHKWWWEE